MPRPANRADGYREFLDSGAYRELYDGFPTILIVAVDKATEDRAVRFLQDPAQHVFGRRHTSGEPWTVSARTGDAGLELTVTAAGTTIHLTMSLADGAQVSAPAGWLALAVYGRVRIDGLAFAIDGPANVADRFAAIFGPNCLW